MTLDAIRNSIRSAVREAVRLGAETTFSSRPRAQQVAAEYAEQLIMPYVQAYAEQCVEDAFAAHRLAVSRAQEEDDVRAARQVQDAVL